MLRYVFQKKLIKEQLLSDADIERIADKVIPRISIRLEDEALKRLRDMLNSLGQ